MLIMSCFLFYFSDCQKKDGIVAVIANITDNATFHIQLNETHDFMKIVLHRMTEEMNEERVLQLYTHESDIRIYEYDSSYRRRFSANITIEGITKDIFITLSAVEVADAGFFIAEMRHPESIRKCFTLYVLGERHKNIHKYTRGSHKVLIKAIAS